MESIKYNKREILLHIICNYYSVDKKEIIEKQKQKHWVTGNVLGMFFHLCNDLNLGNNHKVGKHVDRSVITVSHYINKHQYENDEDFENDKKNILELFFLGDKSLFTEFYFRTIPKDKWPDFVQHVLKFAI